MYPHQQLFRTVLAVLFLALSSSLLTANTASPQGETTYTVAPSTSSPGMWVVCLNNASEEDIDEMSRHLGREPNPGTPIQNDDGTWDACWTVPAETGLSFIVKARSMGYKWQPLEGVPEPEEPPDLTPPGVSGFGPKPDMGGCGKRPSGVSGGYDCTLH